MPQQQQIINLPHASISAITAGTGTNGTAVVFTGQGAYDYEVELAVLAGLVIGNTYNVTNVFSGVGNPTVSLNGIKGSFDVNLFDVGAAAVYGVGPATLTNAGTSGRPGQYVLRLSAPLNAGVTVMQQAAGYFNVGEMGGITSIVVTLEGAGYATVVSQTLAMTSAMFAACPGLTGVTGTFALPVVGKATVI